MEITSTPILRISITCPMTEADRREALDFAYENGYRVILSGPKSNGDLTVDHKTFHLVAEKEVK